MKPFWVAELVREVRVFSAVSSGKDIFHTFLHSNLPPVLLGGGNFDTNVILPALSLINQNLFAIFGRFICFHHHFFLLPYLAFETQLQSFIRDVHIGAHPSHWSHAPPPTSEYWSVSSIPVWVWDRQLRVDSHSKAASPVLKAWDWGSLKPTEGLWGPLITLMSY